MKVATLWMFWLFWTEYSRTDDSYLRYFFAYFLLESSDRSVIWSWVGLSQKWSKVQVILHQRDAFLENLKEFNGLLTYLPHVDMNSPFPVIKVLDMLQDEKLPNNKTWSKITFVVIEELFLSQQALHSKKKRIPEGFHGIICWVLLQKSAETPRCRFCWKACHDRGDGPLSSFPKRAGWEEVIAGKPRAEHPKLW